MSIWSALLITLGLLAIAGGLGAIAKAIDARPNQPKPPSSLH